MAKIIEPIDQLLGNIFQAIAIKLKAKKQHQGGDEDTEEDSTSFRILVDHIMSLIDRMMACDLEDFDLQGVGFSLESPEGSYNQGRAELVIGAFEAISGFIIQTGQTPPIQEDVEKIIKCFHIVSVMAFCC